MCSCGEQMPTDAQTCSLCQADGAWLPEPAYRKAVPWEHPEDFREAVQLTADMVRIRDAVEKLFLDSEEIAMLRQCYDTQTPIDLVISSSRKYTRFKFPNCTKLKTAVYDLLRDEHCDITGQPFTCDGCIELTVPRLGNLHHVRRYGDPNHADSS